MRFQELVASTLMGAIWLSSVILPARDAYAQNALTPDQLDQLLAPVALYPDALLAQICTASTDPQQILDVDNWLRQNPNLSGQARTDAAQQQGFDPAFIALINFPQVLDMMAQNIDNFAAIGQAFAANQATVMDSVQRLRQQAYAVGALESNQFQTVHVQPQGASQVVVIQPANPQIIFVPQYNPQVVFAQPSTAVFAGPLLTFGSGIALGGWISNNRYPWGWGGWGWNWGRRNVIVNNNFWVVGNNRYRPRYRSFRPRPPVFNRPVYVRPPSNWRNRPCRPRNPGGRPPGTAPGSRPPTNRPTSPPNRPAPQQPNQRPPSNQGNPPRQPSGRPSPSNPQAERQPGQRPGPQRRPNPNAGFRQGQGNERANSGGRSSAFGGGNNAAADRAAINRGRSSAASQQRQRGGGNQR